MHKRSDDGCIVSVVSLKHCREGHACLHTLHESSSRALAVGIVTQGRCIKRVQLSRACRQDVSGGAQDFA